MSLCLNPSMGRGCVGLLVLIILPAVLCARFSKEKEIYDYLLDGYDRNVRPVKDPTHPVRVNMQLVLDQILEMDEKSQVMSSHVSFLQIWTDEYLAWNSSDYSAQELLSVPADEIWGMFLYVQNSVGDTSFSLEAFTQVIPSFTLIAQGGRCITYAPYVLKTSCPMDTAMFPFDKQKCHIIVGSWIYDSARLELKVVDPPVSRMTNKGDFGEWQITDVSALNRSTPYKMMFGSEWKDVLYDEIVFTFSLSRNPMFYMNNVVVPTALLGLVAIFSFLLPPECGERISLCLTTLLAVAVYAMVVADNVPESSRSVPLIIRLLFLYMGIIAVCTLWSVVAIRCYLLADTYSCPPSHLLEKITSMSACAAVRQRMKTRNFQNRSVKKTNQKQDNHVTEPLDNQTSDSEEAQDCAFRWRHVIIGLDRIFFFIFLIILVIGTTAFLYF